MRRDFSVHGAHSLLEMWLPVGSRLFGARLPALPEVWPLHGLSAYSLSSWKRALALSLGRLPSLQKETLRLVSLESASE